MGLPENKKLYDSLPLNKKRKAIDFLKTWIYKEDIKRIYIAMKKDPEGWIWPHHFHWGMAVRNALRTAKYGEEYFKIGNLDDIYTELVEEAVSKKHFES